VSVGSLEPMRNLQFHAGYKLLSIFRDAHVPSVGIARARARVVTRVLNEAIIVYYRFTVYAATSPINTSRPLPGDTRARCGV